jgi:hypothetical protein
VRFEALFQKNVVVDADDDGEHDLTDACPGTNGGSAVDASGCSKVQLCEAIEPRTFTGALSCLFADWRNDSSFGSAGDCQVAQGSCTER